MDDKSEHRMIFLLMKYDHQDHISGLTKYKQRPEITCPANSIWTLSQNRRMHSPAWMRTPPLAWAVLRAIVYSFITKFLSS